MAELAAYGGLFLWSFLASTLLPLGSEPALVAIVRQYDQILLPIVVATAGNYLGACTTFVVGKAVGRATEGSDRNSRSYARALSMMQRYGAAALLLSWVPFLGDALVAIAGAVGIRFAPFTVWVVLGKAARYAFVAWIALMV